jgi:hypothetical protein
MALDQHISVKPIKIWTDTHARAKPHLTRAQEKQEGI